MSNHTTGRLRAIEFSEHAPTTLVVDGGGRKIVIAECSGNGRYSWENIPNAQRLAACWNACEGIPTHVLEPVSLNDLIARVKKERDQLIESLRKIASGDGHYGEQAREYKKIARDALAPYETKVSK